MRILCYEATQQVYSFIQCGMSNRLRFERVRPHEYLIQSLAIPWQRSDLSCLPSWTLSLSLSSSLPNLISLLQKGMHTHTHYIHAATFKGLQFHTTRRLIFQHCLPTHSLTLSLSHFKDNFHSLKRSINVYMQRPGNSINNIVKGSASNKTWL